MQKGWVLISKTEKGKQAIKKLDAIRLPKKVTNEDEPFIVEYYLTGRLKLICKPHEIEFVVSSALKPFGVKRDVDYELMLL